MHDWLRLLHGSNPPFPVREIAIKVALTLALGLLVGFEREWSNKDTGARTFAMTALLGLLGSLLGPNLLLLGGAAVLILIVFANLRSLQVGKKLEATTSVSLLLIFMLGVLVGQGHLFTPVACSILVAMFFRNVLILATFAHSAIRTAAIPLLATAAIAVYWIYRNRNMAGQPDEGFSLRLASPVSLRKVMSFALLFLVVQALATLGQRLLGSTGFQIVSVLGGLVSSASTAAAYANMALHGKVTSAQAGMAVVLTSMASALVDLPIVVRQAKNKLVTRDLAVSSLLQVAIGIAALVLKAKFIHIF